MTKKFLLFVVIIFFCTISFAEEKFPFLGQITSDKVNVRAGQSLNFERLFQVNKGDSVVVVAREYGWVKIKLPEGAECYIASKFVDGRPDNIGIVTRNRVNVRAKPVETSSSVGRLEAFTRVKILEELPGWYRILPIEGIYGWISEDLVAFQSNDIPPPRVVVEAPPKPVEPPPPVVEEKKPPPLFVVVGKVQRTGRVIVSQEIRHKLVVDAKTTYYLDGDKATLDHLLKHNVKVEGELTEVSKGMYKYPIIHVVNISDAP